MQAFCNVSWCSASHGGTGSLRLYLRGYCSCGKYDFTAGDTVPEDILRALVDETVIKRAHNVNFERICLSKYLRDNYPHIFRSYSIPEDTVGDYLSAVNRNAHKRYSKVWRVGIGIHAALGNITVTASLKVNFYAYATKTAKGIACGLNNLMKVKDGEPLGGHSRAEDDFADIDDDFLS